jgi:hypothetical protein
LLDDAYRDKLHDKIAEEFWTPKDAEWRSEEQHISSPLKAAIAVNPQRWLHAARILKLANNVYISLR